MSPNTTAFPPWSVILLPDAICNVAATVTVVSDSSVITPAPETFVVSD